MIAEALAIQQAVDWRAVLAESRDLLMPEVILTLFACAALVLDVILPRERHRWTAYATLFGTLLAAVSLASLWSAQGDALPRLGFYRMIVVDDFALVFKVIFLVGLAISIALSLRYLDLESEQRGEFYALMAFATAGMMLMASGYDLLSLYIALELMALSVYVLVGFLKRNRESNEASMKYFLLGAFSSGVLLYGFSLLYGLTGSMNLADIAEAIPALVETGAVGLLIVAMVLVAAGMLFKVAAAPFHMWAPDAYEGAPTPVTAFMSVGVKAASFALFARLFLEGIPGLRSIGDPYDGGLPGWALLLGVVAALTMTWGNIGAITQKNAKRLLAYSAISHAGFLLLGLVAGNETGYTGLVIYLIVYLAMNLGAFGVVVALKRKGLEGDRLEDFEGLARRAPWLAGLMTIFLLSLGGIPPTAGFIGKLYLFYGLLETGDPWLARLALLAVLNTAVSVYYYLLFVKAMYMTEPAEDAPDVRTDAGIRAALVVTAALTLLVGIFPQPAIAVSKRAVDRFRPAAWSPKQPPEPERTE